MEWNWYSRAQASHPSDSTKVGCLASFIPPHLFPILNNLCCRMQSFCGASACVVREWKFTFKLKMLSFCPCVCLRKIYCVVLGQGRTACAHKYKKCGWQILLSLSKLAFSLYYFQQLFSCQIFHQLHPHMPCSLGGCPIRRVLTHATWETTLSNWPSRGAFPVWPGAMSTMCARRIQGMSRQQGYPFGWGRQESIETTRRGKKEPSSDNRPTFSPCLQTVHKTAQIWPSYGHICQYYTGLGGTLFDRQLTTRLSLDVASPFQSVLLTV